MSGITSAHYKRVGLSFGFLFFILALCCPGVSTAQEWTTSGTNIHNANSGNVGVGTASPDSALTVTNDDGSVYTGHFKNSNGTSPTLWIEATGNDNNDTGVFKVDVNGLTRLMVSNYDGNVGIGTTSPDSVLTIRNDNSSVYTGHFKNSNGTSPTLWVEATGNDNNDTGVFKVDVNGSTRFMVSNYDGNVGIGTTTPSATLDVVGNATFSGTVTGGNIQAVYQDVAEWVPASSAILPGTVVILDMAHSNQVVFSSNAYDMRVAGVVSATPGLLLGEGGEGKVKVATTGRVKVKVDATRKPIRVGDLLVTSDQEGMAMRSEPLDFGGIPIHRPGTILGKALESLSEGEGEILVLLTLQ